VLVRRELREHRSEVAVSAISFNAKLAGSPTVNMSVAARWVATTGGVSGCPPVRSVTVTSYVATGASAAAGETVPRMASAVQGDG
jgi:hypothetical protein